MSNKKDKKINEPPKLHYFILKVEGLVPAEVKFRVQAEDEEQAYKLFETRPDKCTPLQSPRPLPGKIKPTKISINNAMSGLITWVRKF